MNKKISGLIIAILLIGSIVSAQDTSVHENGITVNGIIESIGGGFKFPDGTVQNTASSGGSGGGSTYVRVAIVAQGGGDYTDPLSAMNNIATWCGVPSISNPCLLKIMPGVYDIGTSYLQMHEYVDIEGAGENVTKIVGNFGDNSWTGVVHGADFAEIRFLTVENSGGGNFAIAIFIHDASPKLTNITAIGSGATENVGIMCQVNCFSTMTNVTAVASGGSVTIGVYIEGDSSPLITNLKAIASDGTLNLGFDFNNNCSPTMTNVSTTALRGTNNHALHINNSSSPIMNNVTADASGVNSYGVYTKNFAAITGGTIRLDHSVIKGTTGAIYTNTTFTILIGNSRIGGSVTGPGTNTCAGVYDYNYTFYPNICP